MLSDAEDDGGFVSEATAHAESEQSRAEERRARELDELLAMAANGEAKGRAYTDEEYALIKEQFVIWLAMPEGMRTPPSQTAFAEKWGISRRTCLDWRSSPDVKRKLDRSVRHLMWDYVPGILHSVGQKAIEGSYQHARLALEVAQVLDNDVQRQYSKQDEVEMLERETAEGSGSDPFALSMDELMDTVEEMVERHKKRKEIKEGGDA